MSLVCWILGHKFAPTIDEKRTDVRVIAHGLDGTTTERVVPAVIRAARCRCGQIERKIVFGISIPNPQRAE